MEALETHVFLKEQSKMFWTFLRFVSLHIWRPEQIEQSEKDVQWQLPPPNQTQSCIISFCHSESYKSVTQMRARSRLVYTYW